MKPINDRFRSSYFLELFLSVFSGALIGLIVVLFFKALDLIAHFQKDMNQHFFSIHLILLPVVLIVLHLVKKKTLYFPVKIFELSEHRQNEAQFWNSAMMPLHFLGTLLSHLSGASVGREGAVVMMAAGLVRLFKTSWQFWGPIFAAAGFASAVGPFWIAPVFLAEVFQGRLKQQIYTLLSAQMASIIMQLLSVPHLLSPLELDNKMSFSQKMIFVLLISFLGGSMMRYYKKYLLKWSEYFSHRSFYLRLGTSLVLAAILAVPLFQKYQSLSLYEIEQVMHQSTEWYDSMLKLGITLLSLSIGFLGGDFVPLLFSSLSLGSVVSRWLNVDVAFGTLAASYLLFAGATRLRWTSYLLTLHLVGFGWWFWGYVSVSLVMRFAGPQSLYKRAY